MLLVYNACKCYYMGEFDMKIKRIFTAIFVVLLAFAMTAPPAFAAEEDYYFVHDGATYSSLTGTVTLKSIPEEQTTLEISKLCERITASFPESLTKITVEEGSSSLFTHDDIL